MGQNEADARHASSCGVTEQITPGKNLNSRSVLEGSEDGLFAIFREAKGPLLAEAGSSHVPPTLQASQGPKGSHVLGARDLAAIPAEDLCREHGAGGALTNQVDHYLPLQDAFDPQIAEALDSVQKLGSFHGQFLFGQFLFTEAE